MKRAGPGVSGQLVRPQALRFEVYLFCLGEQLVLIPCLWQNSNHDLPLRNQVADFISLGHFLMFWNVTVFSLWGLKELWPPPSVPLPFSVPCLYLSKEAQGGGRSPSGGLFLLPPCFSEPPIHLLETATPSSAPTSFLFLSLSLPISPSLSKTF